VSKEFRIHVLGGLSMHRSLFESDGFFDGIRDIKLHLDDALFVKLSATLTLPKRSRKNTTS